MQRFPWPPRLRHVAIARPLVIAAVTALALAVLAAGSVRRYEPDRPPTDPNGCPNNKSAKTAPIADIKPPVARLQIADFDVLSGSINARTESFTLKVRVGSTCSVNIKGASVYVTAVPYNQFSIPDEELTGDEGTATLVFRRDANFLRASSGAVDALHPRNEAGRGSPRRCLDKATRRRRLLRLALVPCVRPRRPTWLVARPSHPTSSAGAEGRRTLGGRGLPDWLRPRRARRPFSAGRGPRRRAGRAASRPRR